MPLSGTLDRMKPLNLNLNLTLQDTLDRTKPLWDAQILPDLKAGRNVMIVAHANRYVCVSVYARVDCARLCV